MTRREIRAPSLALLGALACVRPDAPGPGDHEPAQCVIAHVGGTPVLTSETDVLRAILQPPPTAEQARRLALTITAYYRQAHLDGDLPRIEARLAWYSERVSKSRFTDFTAAPVQPGPCWAGKFDASGPTASSPALSGEHGGDTLSTDHLVSGEYHD